jgi:carnitine O-acetyltransferase
LTRIPKPECDIINAKPTEKNGRHIHIMLNDWCYTIQAYDGAGRNVGVKELEHRIREVVKDVQKREAEGQRAKRIGILTSDDRTQWAKVSPLVAFWTFESLNVAIESRTSLDFIRPKS